MAPSSSEPVLTRRQWEGLLIICMVGLCGAGLGIALEWWALVVIILASVPGADPQWVLALPGPVSSHQGPPEPIGLPAGGEGSEGEDSSVDPPGGSYDQDPYDGY